VDALKLYPVCFQLLAVSTAAAEHEQRRMSSKHIVYSGEAAAQALSVDALQLYPVWLQLLAVPAAAAAALIKPGCGGTQLMRSSSTLSASSCWQYLQQQQQQQQQERISSSARDDVASAQS
jgi:hypothetical protein